MAAMVAAMACGKEQKTVTESPLPLPAGGISTPGELAELLLPAIPQRDREKVPVLIAEIYRHKQVEQNLAAPVMLGYIYEHLVKTLQEIEPPRRLLQLERESLSARLEEHSRRAFVLAEARYLATGRPLSDTLRENWLFDPELIARLRSMSVEQIEAEAATRREDVDAISLQVARRFADDIPFKIRLRDVEQVLEVARSGDFTRAGGSLHDFLVDAGEFPSEIPPYR